MAKDVKKKNTSKKAAKVQKEETKVTVEKVEVTNKKLKKETKPVKKEELKKVNWPSKKDLTKYGVATIIFIVIFGLYFYGLDALFAWLSSLVKGL